MGEAPPVRIRRTRTVCAKCIGEDHLAKLISKAASHPYCSFCRRRPRRNIAVSFRRVLRRIEDTVEEYYDDAANQSVPYESAEGGYQMSTMDTWEMLEEIGLWAEGDSLRQALVDSFPDYAWIGRDPLSLTDSDKVRFGWRQFCRLVKHRSRYLFFPAPGPYDDEVVGPGEMLDTLADIIRQLDLVTDLPSGTLLYRAHVHGAAAVLDNTLVRLGPPSAGFARYSNRMSPAGVPMMYAGLQEATALAETHIKKNGEPTAVTVATLELIRAVPVLDLTRVPRIPSLFSRGYYSGYRNELLFLEDFLEDFHRLVKKDGAEHVDYVPPQVVTEYVRHRLPEKLDRPIDGILYRSVQAAGGKACVLFFSGEDCGADCPDDYYVGDLKEPPFILRPELTHSLGVDTTPEDVAPPIPA